MDAEGRKLLETAVGQIRRVLEADLGEVLVARYGIHPDGRVEEEGRLRLSAADRATRAELLGVLQHLRATGLASEQAAARLLREAAFTTLNRLVAIRVAEAAGLLPESLARGKDSQGYRDVVRDVFPLLKKDATGGYWTYLRLCADELAHDAPVLFDPRNPLLALEPSPKALDELVGVLADGALSSCWSDPEALGWTYQYFVSREERDAAREEAAPRNSHELAVRNQWFTPRYVVDFLVHNTLGRRLLEANPDSTLREELTMLVAPPQGHGRALGLEEVRVLDPAVGSGHFLLGCYDVLERAWEEQGVPPAEAAARILPCLWGIDIDPRCAQVAAATLMLRARRRDREGDLPRPKVFTARSLPSDPNLWQRALAGVDGGLTGLAQRIAAALEEAPVLGSLLKIEDALANEIKRYSGAAGSREGTLFEGVAADAFARLEGQLLEALHRVAAEASSTAAERLLAAEATDAIGFIEAMRGRYDTVLMNPPFGDPIPETKEYLLSHYTRIHAKQYNVLGPFVERGVGLLRDGGYLGAITSRAAFFLVSFEKWRREVVLAHRLVALADLGYGVMEGAMVEAAAYVLGAEPRRRGEEATFLRLLKDTDRPAALAEACRETRVGKLGGRVFRVAPEELEEIPGAPLAYWVAPSIRRLFSELPPLEGNGAEVRQGLATADDFRFVRAFWEVAPAKIGRSREETFRGKRWVPFAKGGEYSPYYADIHLVVDWEEDGRRIRDYIAEQYPYLEGNVEWVVKNTQHYFRPGLTWPRRQSTTFTPYVLPAGSIFADKGPAGSPLGCAPHVLLGFFTSRLIDTLLRPGLAAEDIARSYEVGLVQKLPWPGPKLTGDAETLLARQASKLIAIRASFDEGDETARRFISPAVLRHDGRTLDYRLRCALDAHDDSITRGIALAYEAERILHEVLDLDAEAERYLDQEYGPHPASYPRGSLAPEEEQEFARLYQTPIDKVIDEVVKTRGGARTIATKSYFLDRRLEVLAHVFGRHPSVLVEARRRLGLLPPEEPRRSAEDLISYLVGCAFGRFDVRIGRDPSLAPPAPDPFDPVPICSPGMLVGPDGLPAREAPEGYPLELPPDRILLDEEGHRWDIVLRVRRAAEVLFDEPDAILEECERVLGRDLRGYLCRDFFRAHLGRYSKSRRKAPIYWQLSVLSREWGIWVYAPTLSRETLFAIVREARRKEASLLAGVERLRRDARAAEGEERRALERQLEADESLLEEVKAFRAEAERVAELGWEPDLDDGIVLCAAPLADLLPAWKAQGRADSKNPADPQQARKLLKAGRFPWSAVSRFAERL
ncbi:MAG TPA: BREX-1 system adenine-specific DNA-methyltransferase PglX [Actinomycetota bacterium]|nr:BREX-1 system adenine-specific DNA-methyltransferase PglX [Actinomycetota bacterium]